MIEVEDLYFSYGEEPLLERVTFEVEKGEVVSLLGCSGSGKSTIFRLLVGLLKPKVGRVSLSGSFSYMMQEDLLLPWRSALDNVLLASELGKRRRDEGRAKDLLSCVGLEGRERALPGELSMGMRKRVTLARALYVEAPILLLDEPFSALDLITKESMYALLKEIQKESGVTILLITHDFHDALYFCGRALVLRGGSISPSYRLDSPEESIKESLRLELS